MTTTPNTPPNPAQPPAQNGSRIAAWIKRHTKGVVIGAIMGLGVMAIAGGGLGGYVAYVKQKAPAAVQDTAIPAAETIASVAETTARVVVGGPGGGERSPVAAAGLAALSPGDGSMPTAPETGTNTVEIRINPTNITVSEGDAALLTVERTPGSSTDSAIDFVLTAREFVEGDGNFNSGKQTEGDRDFAAGNYRGTIAAGANSATVNIATVDDEIAESTEHFNVILSASVNFHQL